ncbi:MAG: glycosyltransferase family 4 protein [Cytophagaceae bacterium]|jgi:glycosyltransferase involved in cell wall biosynthesis|nr:glycosyltransferase family 4 protein [Cytophagaceae bacterium]
MHICFLSHEYPLWATGGIGSFIQSIGRGLVQNGHRVTVIGSSNLKDGDCIDDEGVSIYRLPAPKYFRKGSFIENAFKIKKKLKEIHREKPVDIVETGEAGLFFISRRMLCKKVIRLHGGHHFFAESENRPINSWKATQERISFKKANAFAAATQYVINHTGKYLSMAGRPVEVINFPIDSSRFPQADLSKTKKHKLVFAGTVCEKKGIRQLIQAIPLVAEKYPDVTLDVYGREWFFSDGSSYTQYLKGQFSENILSHVTFRGAIKLAEVPSKYEEAELCVFPSHMETLGLVAPEAMMTGKPVMFSDTGPGPEIVLHHVTGLLCNPYSTENIAENILFAFNNPDKMQTIALEGQKFALAKFDIKSSILANIEFYESLLRK